jgi:BirA family biotin operon repressor/biotin-[acetyl-CoA-carboxylase] ligase
MKIFRFETIDSTMCEASRLAAAGAASGTTVVAEEQTAGQGRHGRTWHSEPGAGLYLSVILRFPFEPETVPVVTLALGLAVVEAIHEATGIVCDLRWPNDVLIRDRKCAGILTQLEGAAVIAGIGINVNHSAFPEELSAVATSLRIAGGREQSREELLTKLLPTIDSYCDLLARQGKEPILDMFTNASSYVRGRRVKVDDTMEGITAGLNESGFLLLRDDAGRQHTILAGGVRPCS